LTKILKVIILFTMLQRTKRLWWNFPTTGKNGYGFFSGFFHGFQLTAWILIVVMVSEIVSSILLWWFGATQRRAFFYYL